MTPVAKEMVLVLVGHPRDMFVSLHMRSSSGQEIYVHGVPVITSGEGAKMSGDRSAV